MSVKDPVHLLFGYVEIEGKNGFAERFINCCTAEGIPLWDMRKNGERIFAKTTADGFRKIRSPARKSSMRIRLLSKHGLPFILERYLRRTGMIIGIALFAVILAFLSSRIWIIEVDNSTDIPDEKIIQSYENAGLKIGSSRCADVKRLRSDVLCTLDEASWTTVNITGSTATIKVSKVIKNPPVSRRSGVSNIVASKDGQVEIIEPYSGSAAVKAGQTVTKGDILISGVTESRIQTYIFRDSDGYVAAGTNTEINCVGSDSITQLVPKSRKVYYLYFLGREIPLGFHKNSECIYLHKSWLQVGGKKMPFGIYYRMFTDYEERETMLNTINDYSIKVYNRMLHAQTVSKDISVIKENGSVSICGKYYCYENIGEKVPVEIEEIPEEKEEAP